MTSETEPARRHLEKLAKRLFANLKKWIVLPLVCALIGVMVIGRLTNWGIGPKAYKIYVVGRFDDEAPRQIWGGVSEGESQLRALHGVTLVLKRVVDLGECSNTR